VIIQQCLNYARLTSHEGIRCFVLKLCNILNARKCITMSQFMCDKSKNNSFCTVCNLQFGPIAITEMSVTSYQLAPRNTPEGRRPQLHRGRSLKPRKCYCLICWWFNNLHGVSLDGHNVIFQLVSIYFTGSFEICTITTELWNMHHHNRVMKYAPSQQSYEICTITIELWNMHHNNRVMKYAPSQQGYEILLLEASVCSFVLKIFHGICF
jgi:hypothetical protein